MSAEQHEAYDDATEVYSDPFGLISRDNRNHREKRRAIVAALPFGAEASVLEVGCGDGLHARWYQEFFDEFAGVDLSESLCEQARARSGAKVVQCDARTLPWDDNSVDGVVGAAVLHHLPDIRVAFREWCRVANDAVVLMEPNYLFPKDLVTAYAVEEEQHKTQMAPWRVRRALDDIESELDATATLDPWLYTPPWPRGLVPVFDRVDEVARRVPGLRWSAQMLRITIRL